MNFKCQSMVGTIDTIILKRPEAAFVSQRNLDTVYEAYDYIGCPNFEKVKIEFEAFENIIKSNVENVLYLPFDDRTGIDSIYTHDTVKITSKGAIYFPMGKKLRKGEPDSTREYLESMGIPTLGVIESPARIEGGDIVWLDEKTVAIGRGYRTNEEGIKRFKELTEGIVDEIIVVPMPHGEGESACLHLMSVISLVDKDLAVVYSKYMPVFFREYLIKKGIKLIETPDKEYDYLGTNVLALAPRKCVVLKGNPVVKEKLISHGAEVFEYEGHELSYRGTGGPTCLTCPVYRI